MRRKSNRSRVSLLRCFGIAVGVVLLLLITALPVQAIRSGPEPTLKQALLDADLVVHATVESAESAWVDDEWGRHIWTTYRLRAASYLKGASRGDFVALRILGGTVGDTSEVVFDLQRPALSQEAVFVLSASPDNGPLALERMLPVEAGEVRLDHARVPLSRLAEALAQLTQGESNALEQILQRPTVVTLPAASNMGAEEASDLLSPRTKGTGSNSTTSLYAVLYDASWSNFVDNDGDGYARSGVLTWDADVGGGSGSLTVYFDVFVSPTGAGAWTFIGSTGPHTITGTSSSDTASMTISGSGAPAIYDFAIGVYQQGASVYDDELYPSQDPDLSYLGFEGAGYDSAPVIGSISPSRGSAGTNTQVTINGTGFGSSPGIVAFFFQYTGDPITGNVPADILSWSDTRIVCTVPICDPHMAECGGYPGGASSGPVTVVTSSLAISNPVAFEVPFGYSNEKWNPPQVDYYIATSVPVDFSAAIENAASTWASAAGIGFAYSGSTTASVTSQNGTTELMYGPLPPGSPAATIAHAICWSQGTTVTECDILFNSAQPFSTATPTPPGSFDVESIALHEFGHWLVLLDLYGDRPGYPSDTAKVMYGVNGGGPDWMKRTLHPDDVAGARWIYGTNSCTYSISPASQNFSANGGSGSFSVNTQAGCTWNATANRAWIHVTSGSSGNGSGTVNFSVDANGTSSSRSGAITAAGKTFTINQSGAASCSYSISPTSRSIAASGGNGTVTVSTTAGCSWTATSNSGWIGITGGSSGTGPGSVTYSVAANTGGARTGTMTIAGTTFTVSQAAGGGGGGSSVYQVAGIAHAGGAGGSSWRSTLCITNRSGSTANLTLKYRMSGSTVTRTHTLQNNRIKEWEDVAVSLFNQGGNTSGAIEVTSDTPVLVIARTYNEGPDGTFGQALPGNEESSALTSGDIGILPLLKKTSAFRTNVGFMNHTGVACNVRIKLHSEQGNQLGSLVNVSVPAYGWKQVNDVFDAAGVSQCQVGYATVEVITSGGKIWAYGSVVDNGTGDPTTVPVMVE